MAVCNPGWEKWLDRLYNLRRDKSGSHERPHKPALLLSIIDLLDHGVITRNEVPLSDELVATFKHYFAIVRKHNDQPTIQNPFSHLCGDKFWRLVPATGEREIYQEGSVSQVRELLNLRRLPAMLNMAQTAAMLGLAEHDIPVLVRAGLLKPLGNPPPNAVKSFATVQVMELAGEIASLNKIRNTVYEYWRDKNASRGGSESKFQRSTCQGSTTKHT